jgi:hypothetical protein
LGVQFFLVDFENVQPASVGSLKPGTTRIKIFLGEQQSKLPLELSRSLQPFGADVEFIQISGSGPNAVDFHIAFYIGKLCGSHPDASYTIVSRDTGFDPLVRHLKGAGIACRRVAAIDGTRATTASKVAATPTPAAVKKAASPKPKPAGKIVAANPPVANAQTAAQKAGNGAANDRVAEIIKRLKGLKAAKPAKLKTLQSSVQSWFKPALSAKEVASVIQGLADAKKIRIDGTRVSYLLG